jgi:YD repeat-containing protein
MLHYDALGQTTVVADALGAVTRTTYDALGHIATTTDAAGQVMQVSYDALDRLIRVTENAASGSCAAPPCNLVTQYQYDPAGNVNSWFVFVDGMSPAHGVTPANNTTLLLRQLVGVWGAAGPYLPSWWGYRPSGLRSPDPLRQPAHEIEHWSHVVAKVPIEPAFKLDQCEQCRTTARADGSRRRDREGTVIHMRGHSPDVARGRVALDYQDDLEPPCIRR